MAAKFGKKGVVHFGSRKLEKHIPLIELLPGNFFPDTELLYTAKILKKTTPFINNSCDSIIKT